MLINHEFDDNKIRSPLQYAWSIFKENNIYMSAMWAAIVFIFIAIFADLINPALLPKYPHIFLPPYWCAGGNATHVLGTDSIGRDNLSRILQGIQSTLGGALLITFPIFFLGTFIGATAALMKGIKSSIIHHLLDALLVVPTLLMALIIITIFGASYENILFAVSLSLLPQFTRSIHMSIESELQKQYVISLRLDGATNIRLLRFGIFPNMVEPIINLCNRIFTMAILEIATLGFLGFGAHSLTPELGALIADGINSVYSSPWLVIFPGLTIFIIICVFNISLEGIRHAVIEVEDE